MARAKSNSFHELTGLLLLAVGLMLFLSLISFSPRQVPAWVAIGKVAGNGHVARNFIGPVGAVLAWYLFQFLGAAAFLLTAVVLGCGGAKLLFPSLRLSTRVGWCAGFILSGACLLQFLPVSLIDAGYLGIHGDGGWMGWFFGRFLSRNLLGTVGTVILLTLLYAVCLIVMTGIHPVDALRHMMTWPPRGRDAWNAWLEARAARRAALQAQTDRAMREAARDARKAERTNTRKTPSRTDEESSPAVIAPPAEQLALPVADAAPLVDEPTRPQPKIFDATLPPPPRKKEKKDKLPPLSPVSCENYELPSMDLLDITDSTSHEAADPDELLSVQTTVIDTLAQFGISVAPGDITRGPTITRYEVYPAKGIRVDRILSLERDIARATRAERINILAPIPGKDTVGIEIANSKKQKVTLRELLESDDFHSTKAKIPIALGKDVYGKTIIGDLAAMPHGLVAGTTGSGKSVCINAIIASILYRFTPEDLRFIMIDPKVVEMQVYNTLPHLVVPVVTDPKKVLLAMRWAIDEMEKRYAIFAKTGVRNIGSFNSRQKPKTQRELDLEKAQGDLFKLADAKAAAVAAAVIPEPPAAAENLEGAIEGEGAADLAAEANGDDIGEVRNADSMKPRNSREYDLIIPDRMPYIVIIVDELADLMQTAPADVESAIARITQKARAAGIHMIIATQTPRADVITGVIKANVPCRIAFQVASALDSRVILDENGAEKLLGQGDMMYRPPGTSKMIRSQGVLVTDDEIRRVVEHASAQGEPAFESSIQQKLEGGGGDEEEEVSDEDEELVDKCIEVMRQEKKASTSLFQRRLRLGYTRAARILDILEMRGYVAPGEGAKPREILVDLDAME